MNVAARCPFPFLYKLVNPVLYFTVVHNIIVDALLYKRHI